MRQTLILVVTRQTRGEVLVRKIALTLWRVTYIMPTSIEQRQEIMFPDLVYAQNYLARTERPSADSSAGSLLVLWKTECEPDRIAS